MADILTHLRELSFGYGILSNNSDLPTSPVDFLDFCKNNIENCAHLSLKDVAKLQSSFNDNEINTIENGIKLAKYILHKKIITSSHPVVNWTGSATQSGSASDIVIDDIPFSLKEESFILHNMGLYQFINIIIDKNKYARGLHIFEEYAMSELNDWFEITRDIMIEMIKDEPFQIQDSKLRNIKLSYSSASDKLYLFFYDNEEYIDNFSTCNYIRFKKTLSSKYKEKVFAKYLNNKLSDNKEYLKYKKICSEKAGENLVSFLWSEIQNKPSPKSLYSLFRIEKQEYYYAKTTNKTIEVYKIPSQSEFKTKVDITNIRSSVPKSQLNIFTTIENIKTNEKLVVRNELRYSHGQFNGTPEAKMYIDSGSLLIAYEKV